MQKSLLHLTIFTSILLATGCSKKVESIPEVEQILAPTETKASARTPEWYASQDDITPEVLKSCINYYIEKSERVGGQYKNDIDNDIYSKFQEVPDCLNARKGEILNMSKKTVQLTQDQLDNIETELNKPENIEHINKVAQDVANQLNQQSEANKENDQEAQKIFEQYLNKDTSTSEPQTTADGN